MEQKHYYTDERNAQIVIALLKAHGIKRVVANPGTTNLAFVGSVQNDPWFEMYSADDERHGGYLACGMAAESGEPVVLSCTGATAGRNYLPALTEAYYRKLPVFAITSSQIISHEGQLISQFADRRVLPNDAAKLSVQVPPVYTDAQAKDCAVAVNKAILELGRRGGGPVHINLESYYAGTFNTLQLPTVKKIERHYVDSEIWPTLDSNMKIAIWVGSHKCFSARELHAIESFVRCHNCVVLCDATSNYYGVNRVVSAMVATQRGIRENPKFGEVHPDLIIHIGEVSNDYSTQGYLNGLAPVWRVNPDGEVRDRFGRLEHVFEMPESVFFDHYACDKSGSVAFCKAWQEADAEIRKHLPDLPFSNLWIAKTILPRIPETALFHFGLSTSLQMWTSQLQIAKVPTISNVGVCGIDGILSAAIGASLASPEKLVYCVLGDLAFFYDLNALGNRHIGNNLRIILVNNGCGAMFHSPTVITSQFGAQVNDFTAAGRHFGNKSKDLVRHFVTDLGFKYLTASTKDELLVVMDEFLSLDGKQSLVLECFTDADDDGQGFAIRDGAYAYEKPQAVSQVGAVKKIVPQRVKNAIKELIR